MLRSLFTWLLLLGAALTISACCVNNSCDCRDGLDDAVYLKFSLDTLSATSRGFYYAELRSFYVSRKPIRAANETGKLPAVDSVRITRTRTQLRDSLILSPTSPFTASGRRFDAYEYTIRLSRRLKITPKAPSFKVTNVAVQGAFNQVNGCCTCYQNTRKQFTINGQAYDFSGQPTQTIVLQR